MHFFDHIKALINMSSNLINMDFAVVMECLYELVIVVFVLNYSCPITFMWSKILCFCLPTLFDFNSIGLLAWLFTFYESTG